MSGERPQGPKEEGTQEEEESKNKSVVVSSLSAVKKIPNEDTLIRQQAQRILENPQQEQERIHREMDDLQEQYRSLEQRLRNDGRN